jgi:hypothetical protein
VPALLAPDPYINNKTLEHDVNSLELNREPVLERILPVVYEHEGTNKIKMP